MLDKHYLIAGLNALSRAHELNYFVDGHRGGAIISAYYLVHENKFSSEIGDLIADRIDQTWVKSGLCADFPEEKATPQLLGHIFKTFDENCEGLRQVGHNTILLSLALKAFRDVPEAITPARVNGICRLIESFTVMDVPLDDRMDYPNLMDQSEAAHFIMTEFCDCVERFVDRGQGWSGHWLTYSRALFDLRELGYADLAQKAQAGHQIFLRRIRVGPHHIDKLWEEHAPSNWMPHDLDYWKNKTGDWKLGHVLKYPYGYYGLMQFVSDAALQERCNQLAFRVF